MKKNYNFEKMTVETFDQTTDFYKNKLDFHYLGKKLRFFKNTEIYVKNL